MTITRIVDGIPTEFLLNPKELSDAGEEFVKKQMASMATTIDKNLTDVQLQDVVEGAYYAYAQKNKDTKYRAVKRCLEENKRLWALENDISGLTSDMADFVSGKLAIKVLNAGDFVDFISALNKAGIRFRNENDYVAKKSYYYGKYPYFYVERIGGIEGYYLNASSNYVAAETSRNSHISNCKAYDCVDFRSNYDYDYEEEQL